MWRRFAIPERGRSVSDREASGNDLRVNAESRTAALLTIAGLMLVGAAWALATILVPFLLALVLAIALSPVANWLERRAFPRTASSLVCMLGVACVLAVGVGLVTYEAGTILQDSDRYINRFGALIDQVVRHPKLAHAAEGADSQTDAKTGQTESPAGAASGAVSGSETRTKGPGRGVAQVRRFIDSLGGWLASGVGGVLGALGGVVVCLAFLFYMLEGRDDWIESIEAACKRFGLRPSRVELEKVRDQVVRYVTVLAMVSCGYVVVVSLALWLIGVPQPILWGLLAGLFEVVPYFGPLIASVLPTVVALSLGSWWQPVVTASLFLVLHTVEGYVITPVLYGKAVKFDPVTILFGALFFGVILGPLGLAVATPLLIVLRGLLMITPDTPVLDALADLKDQKPDPSSPTESVVAGKNGGGEKEGAVFADN